MTMRDQILTGLNAAVADAPNHTALWHLDDLGEHGIEYLADHILAALAVTPEGTPAPSLDIIEAATPVLTLSVADVVARYASDALDDTLDRQGDDLDNAPILIESWASGPDARAVRELIFRIQAMFGARVRSNATTGFFHVAGTPTQTRAMQRVLMTITEAAAPIVADLDADERRVFYATLGTLITEHQDAQRLIQYNNDLTHRATAALVSTYGPARTLDRATPASEGALYDSATQIAPTLTSTTVASSNR